MKPLDDDQVRHLMDQAASRSPTMNRVVMGKCVVQLCQQHLALLDKIRDMREELKCKKTS